MSVSTIKEKSNLRHTSTFSGPNKINTCAFVLQLEVKTNWSHIFSLTVVTSYCTNGVKQPVQLSKCALHPAGIPPRSDGCCAQTAEMASGVSCSPHWKSVSLCLTECRCVCECVRGKKCQGIHCLFSTCYYSGPNQPASQSGASGHLETLLCL